MYPVVLFDFDGTVFDTVEGITKSIRYAINKHGLDLVGVVPQDDGVYDYDSAGKPTVRLPEDNPARKAVFEIAAKLNFA
mgnify:CR=1 FL=1